MSIIEEIAFRQNLRLILLGVGLLAAVIYGAFYCYRPQSLWKTVIKTVPMAACAGALFVSFGSSVVAFALVCSALGDFVLSRNGERPFLLGLGGFSLVHIAYSWHFWMLGGGALTVSFMLPVLVALALSTEIWLSPHTGKLRWFVRFYVVLISLMGVSALALTTHALAMIGAVAFIVSDTLLAMQLFRMREESGLYPLTSVAIWGFYAAGQFLIVAGVGWQTPLF
ncbi:lysoplasmalogenase [Shimia sp. MMG029]|uniref:lysoplasmalogenase n=1 Tax=Shimia sp. MMG029 TaxID=3021978 RepID=UPI0022FED4D6|nr:lysoplasmalogenase [Shimia sp. MMG029]MDA5558091.1 lysoplasmalogenase [Shimia sp. MMG029]